MTNRIFEAKGKPAKSLGDGVFEAKIIQAGWGSSGYYSPELLKEYGPTTFREGRPSFANHPTDDEFANGRDVTKIMGRLISDAEFREADNSLYAQIKVKPEWIDFVEEYKDVIGLSIFAGGTISEGEADGRTGNIVESFDVTDPYTSVDFVVAAGAGGKVERMLESYRTKEALTNDRREELVNLVKDAHSAANQYVWVRDFNDSTNTVYFDVDGDSGFSIYAQSYSVTNDVASELLDEPIEVRVKTEYVPVDVRQQAESSNKEKVMTPEERAEFATAVATAVAEALKPAPKADDEDAPKAATPAEVAEAVRAADLPRASEKRVFEALKGAETAEEVKTVIEAEKTFADELLKESNVEESPGRVREASTATEGRVNIPGWN